MNKDIRFRAWYDDGMIYNTCPCKNASGIMMQYTGRCDKNGKQIYEGDFVKSCYGVRAVEWGVYDLAWMLDKLVPLGTVAGELEIVGNIFEGVQE